MGEPSKPETDVVPPSVHQLRSRWKPTKERLLALQSDHPTHLRFHRACSWLQAVEDVDTTSDRDLDFALLARWTAFNAIYGQWDREQRQPMPDWGRLQACCDRLLALDVEGRIAASLKANRKLVMKLFEDEYLSRFYWEDPSPKQASKSRKPMHDAKTWYQQGQWSLILLRLIERVYLARCQVAHGAATFNSRVNRTSLRRCVIMLGHLVPTFLLVIVEHGVDEDWGQPCYPPSG